MIEQRVERAKKVLAETNVPIAEIALWVRFASQSHFTTTLQKVGVDHAESVQRNAVDVN